RQPTGPVCAQVVPSGPDSPWEAIHRMHVGAIHAARERVWLVTPYFVPGEAAMMALTSAALAGLDVRLLGPRMSDSRLVTLAARSYFGPLLVAGVKIYEYGPRMLHTKALLVDDSTVLVGSANFDHRSFRLNFEVSVLFEDAAMGAALAQLIEGELASAPRVRQGRRRSLLGARLPEALARRLSPLPEPRPGPSPAAAAGHVPTQAPAATVPLRRGRGHGSPKRGRRHGTGGRSAAPDGVRARRQAVDLRHPRNGACACPGCSCCSRSRRSRSPSWPRPWRWWWFACWRRWSCWCCGCWACCRNASTRAAATMRRCSTRANCSACGNW